jgi:NitT/TauT family transport system permease protein
MITGRNQSPKMWTYLKPTLEASVIGTAIGMVTGALAGLLLSNSPLLTKILHPFVVGINAVPRIALIPIIVIIGGIGLQTTVIISVLVVFFVTFFNAFEGGRTVSPQLLQNAKILGAKPWQIMWYVRRPYVFAWSMASLPLALTFSLLTVVTTEILTGQKGMGYLISFSTSTADATLTFASVVVLSVAGMAIVGISAIVKRRALRWWEAGN